MNCFVLLQRATKRLRTVDPDFHENTEVTTAVLRSEGVLPTKRMTLNGKLHKLVSAMIVEAYDADTTIDVNTRRAGTFAYYGYSTKIISYLDKMVKAGLLKSDTGKAQGKLNIGPILDAYMV
jgi:hypothetical protein